MNRFLVLLMSLVLALPVQALDLQLSLIHI